MKVFSTYGTKLYTDKPERTVLQNTIQIYRDALSYIAVVVKENWESIAPVYQEDQLNVQRTVDMMIHATKQNPHPQYDFDSAFMKYPSYFRRATVNDPRLKSKA